MERDMKKGESTKAKGEKKRETVKAVSGGRTRGGGVSPMAATHHSQLNDAIFFPLFPLLFRGRGWRGGVSASIQSKGVNQSSYHSGGTRKPPGGQGEARAIPPSRSGAALFRRVDSQ